MNANPSPPVSLLARSLVAPSVDLCCLVLILSSPSSSTPAALQPSPSQQINLGPSSNPSAKPSDFHFLKVIGKGSFGKVLLARHRADDQFYAVKVLQKKAILKKKEVRQSSARITEHVEKRSDQPQHFSDFICFKLNLYLNPQEKHIMSERNVLLKNVKHPFLVGLHYSFQTADKLYFILDYINGGEVSRQQKETGIFLPRV